MKIGLISDTHIPEAMPELPSQVRTVFAGADLILHAGDLHCLDVLNWLEEIAPVLACRGNGDDGSGGRPVVPEDPRLRDAAATWAAGYRIGLVHDVLDPAAFPQWPIERTMEHYFDGHANLIVCGHTHVEGFKWHGEVLVINPGSPTFPHNYAAQPGTVGVLNLKDSRGGGDVTVYDLKTLDALPELTASF